MNLKFSYLAAPITLAAFLGGCNSSAPKTEAAEKKAFLGGPMPKDFMKNMNAAQNAAQKAAQDAARKNGG